MDERVLFCAQLATGMGKARNAPACRPIVADCLDYRSSRRQDQKKVSVRAFPAGRNVLGCNYLVGADNENIQPSYLFFSLTVVIRLRKFTRRPIPHWTVP